MSNIFHQMKGTITFKKYFKIHANIEISLLLAVSEILIIFTGRRSNIHLGESGHYINVTNSPTNTCIGTKVNKDSCNALQAIVSVDNKIDPF